MQECTRQHFASAIERFDGLRRTAPLRRRVRLQPIESRLRSGNPIASMRSIDGGLSAATTQLAIGPYPNGAHLSLKYERRLERPNRNLSMTLRHWRLRFTEQSLLLWLSRVG